MSPASRDPRASVATMWQTRPTRRQSDRKVAGVAAAIARRYDVDPVLVRIGFVVAAFYGVGILLYLAAWATLEPDPNDPPRGPLAHGTVVRWLLYLVLVIATLGAIHDLVTGDLDLLVGLLVVGGLLYLLQTSRGDRGLELARMEQPGTAGLAGTEHPGTPDTEQPGTADTGQPGTVATASPTPTGPRSRATSVTIAAMLVAAGICGAVLLLGDSGPQGPRLLVGVLLAVVGVGLLVGSFTRGGRGLIVLAIPLLLIGYGVTRFPAQHWQGAGELRTAPASVSEVAASYDRTFGQIELDLRPLDLTAPTVPPGAPPPDATGPAPLVSTAPPDVAGGVPPNATGPAPPGSIAPVGPVRTRVTVGAGEAIVWVPANADVRVHCHAATGDVDCLGNQGVRSGAGPDGSDGPTADARVESLGADGVAGGRTLELDVSVGFGHVEVRRG
ncbi:MAG: PspC domain-containing protein [Actinomycetota bacterium]|nr:PspC domain-containing protein [Actinomycetota bacterium]